MNKFITHEITKEEIENLQELSRICRGDILKMTTLAGCGHPGGSMSSIDMLLTILKFANINPENFDKIDRDRIIISHGHISPAVYSSLGRMGFFPIDEAIAFFRKAESIFEGHVERDVPGIEWTTGNLGQGLSAACGFAVAQKVLGIKSNIFVLMGDGEQQKGQISEARRFAKKFNLTNITVLIDFNRLQISGDISEVMPQDIKANYESDGWEVLVIDGHNFKEIFDAIKYSLTNEDKLVAIIGKTVMGKGVSFMENREKFHGVALKEDELEIALKELKISNDLEKYKNMRKNFKRKIYREIKIPQVKLNLGSPRDYSPEVLIDNRTAFGNALMDLAELNKGKFIVFDCDLTGSVKTKKFGEKFPECFFQSGIQEHNTATMAGACSLFPVISIFADFGVFGVDETYNQHRLNDINNTNLKLICTHIGLNVGEDGKTHHCIDYIGVFSNLYGYKLIIPADPNQTDRAFRFMVKEKGNFFLGMGRAKNPVITDLNGKPLFAGNYEFKYGKADLIRDGEKATIITYGSLIPRAIKAWEKLKEQGIYVKVYNMSTPKDIDIEMLKIAVKTGLIVTYEDHNVNTGIGSIIAKELFKNSLHVKLINLGIENYGYSGTPDEIYDCAGLGVDRLVDTIKNNLNF